LEFVDNIIHLTGVAIHIKKTCNIKLVNNCIDMRTWGKMVSQGKLGRITTLTYFVVHTTVEEMFAKIVKATYVSAPSTKGFKIPNQNSS
jgi:hypothetical protein